MFLKSVTRLKFIQIIHLEKRLVIFNTKDTSTERIATKDFQKTKHNIVSEREVQNVSQIYHSQHLLKINKCSNDFCIM